MPLASVLGSAAPAGLDLTSTRISDLTLDSRAVTAGAAFLACQGGQAHGLAYFDEARQRGARVVLWEPAPGVSAPPATPGVLAFAIPQLRAQAGVFADRYFGEPSRALSVTGVTGTNGKTTCAWLLAQALSALGRPCGYMGTLGVGLAEQLTPGEYTTADAVNVQRQLATLRAAGASSVAMEVSSHALDQQRVAGVRFAVAAFTNLTRDHLDYHGDLASYGAAKARLFRWPDLRWRVINIDDPFGLQLLQQTAGHGRLLAVSRQNARARSADAWIGARQVNLGVGRIEFDIVSSFGGARFEVPLLGAFNADNVLLVLGLLLALDVPLARAVAVLAQARPPRGRMETFGGGAQPLAIVDYAHTPDALSKALQATRQHCQGQVHVVFGCGGDRDSGKRPLMAAAAAAAADQLWITDDNPRSEDPEKIITDIRRGLPAGRVANIERDRAAAIRAALSAAQADDAVLIAGKGHEDYQIIGRDKRPFSDQAVVQQALADRLARQDKR